jgi:hypothetical protein
MLADNPNEGYLTSKFKPTADKDGSAYTITFRTNPQNDNELIFTIKSNDGRILVEDLSTASIDTEIQE